MIYCSRELCYICLDRLLLLVRQSYEFSSAIKDRPVRPSWISEASVQPHSRDLIQVILALPMRRNFSLYFNDGLLSSVDKNAPIW
jgi:hypothetical protein